MRKEMPTSLYALMLNNNKMGKSYFHDAVTSVARILSRVSGRAVYLSLTNPSNPDC